MGLVGTLRLVCGRSRRGGLLPIRRVTRALITWLLVAAALALVPAAALAQNAGDQQYTDPLAGTTPSHPTAHKSTTATASASAPTTTSQSTQSTASSASSSRSSGLPRTGVDVVWLGLTGVLLLGSGVALRRIAERSGA